MLLGRYAALFAMAVIAATSGHRDRCRRHPCHHFRDEGSGQRRQYSLGYPGFLPGGGGLAPGLCGLGRGGFHADPCWRDAGAGAAGDAAAPARAQAGRVSFGQITRRITGNRVPMAGIGLLILWQCGIRLASRWSRRLAA